MCIYTTSLFLLRESGWAGLLEEMEMDIKRLARRNLGRDDRLLGVIYEYCYEQHCNDFFVLGSLPLNYIQYGIVMHVDRRPGEGEAGSEAGDNMLHFEIICGHLTSFSRLYSQPASLF